jgi:hypothetical protein
MASQEEQKTIARETIQLTTTQKEKQLKEQIEEIYLELASEDEIIYHQLPENLFVSEFLPYFCGEMPIGENNELYLQWIAIAGSPMREVSIIDLNGDFLFNVPPLFDTSLINIENKLDSDSFSELLSLYQLKASITPSLGQEFVNTKIADKVDAIFSKGSRQKEYSDRWNEIFIRYNKVSKKLEKKEILNSPEDLIYDDDGDEV